MSKEKRFEILYQYQKNFLHHITQNEDYLFKDQTHGSLKSTKKIEKHLNIYKNNFYSTLITALASRFKATKKSLPENVFKGLCAELIRSFKGEDISSFSQFYSLFPEHLLKKELHKKLPYIVDLARFELLEFNFIKSLKTETFFKASHPVQELRSSLLNKGKLKFKREPFYHYKLSKKDGLIAVTRISEAFYQKENHNNG